jgi:uncharacterized protein (DUF1697 family)
VSRLVVLLRGINVGGRTLVPMPRLRALLEEIGFEDVATYIQSGNVVLDAGRRRPASVAGEIEAAIASRFELDVTVLARTPADLAGLAARNPFLEAESDPKKLHVVFLDREPDAAAVGSLDPDRSPGDRWSADAREIFLHLPNGGARSKLALDWFERGLGVRGTVRNWRTAQELATRAAG